ncbi:MAG: LytTR family DNA-binding domain-containing protein [Lachnospiraceae bacterium]|nr:LytTR family DNA-binding domain-containing protein [Lachnospiraceae bacterium]
MKLAICDDDKRIRDLIAESVKEVSEKIEIVLYEDAKGILSANFDSDILFLDIQMPGIDGMNAARMLRSSGKRTVIVFVTALEDQVFRAFDVGAFHYIVKPFTKARIKEIYLKAAGQAEDQRLMEAALSEQEETGRTITVKSGGTNTRVLLSEVQYAEIYDRRIVLHMESSGDIEYYGRISDLENLCGKDFFRIHRAYLVNLGAVKSYDSKYVHMTDADIPVARGKYPELIKAYLSYHTRREGL